MTNAERIKYFLLHLHDRSIPLPVDHELLTTEEAISGLCEGTHVLVSRERLESILADLESK